jgi:hypothetical protein
MLPQHLRTIVFGDSGWNRTSDFLGVIQASSPLDHGIMLRVTAAGVEPADAQDLGLFALPVCVPGHFQVAGPEVAPGNPGLGGPNEHWPTRVVYLLHVAPPRSDPRSAEEERLVMRWFRFSLVLFLVPAISSTSERHQ